MLQALSDSQAAGPLPFAITAFAGLCCLASIAELGIRLQRGIVDPVPVSADAASAIAGHLAHVAILGAAVVLATVAVLRNAARSARP